MFKHAHIVHDDDARIKLELKQLDKGVETAMLLLDAMLLMPDVSFIVITDGLVAVYG